MMRAREELEHLSSEGAGLRFRHVELDYADHVVRVVGIENHDDLTAAAWDVGCVVLPHLEHAGVFEWREERREHVVV